MSYERANKSTEVINVGGEPIDLQKCFMCCNLGVEGCPMGLFLTQEAQGIKPTPLKKCTAFQKVGEYK